jgi:hypothetical protein
MYTMNAATKNRAKYSRMVEVGEGLVREPVVGVHRRLGDSIVALETG